MTSHPSQWDETYELYASASLGMLANSQTTSIEHEHKTIEKIVGCSQL